VARDFSFLHSVQTGCGPPGDVKLTHPPPSSVEVKNAWTYASTSPYAFIVWSLVKHSDNFITEYQSYWAEFSRRLADHNIPYILRNPKSLLPCSQEPAIGADLEPPESTPHPHTLYLQKPLHCSTPWNRFPEKLIIALLIKKFCAFYGT
jgi:hypothetical protein